ncbi:hypothetical protein RFI_00214, partial [Reticulomyxa filosa]
YGISTAGKQQKETKDNSFKVFLKKQVVVGLYQETFTVDLEPNVIDGVKSGSLGSLFNSNYLLSGKEDAANIFARDHYTVEKQIICKVNDQLQKLMNNCDNAMEFMIMHSAEGGTGSGLGALILERLYTDYVRKKARVVCVIYPSYMLSTSVVEPYNVMLTTYWLTDHTISRWYLTMRVYTIFAKGIFILRDLM